ncbi:SAM-dependent methyltransferase [Streptomyces sp. BE147]|uniref:SAM-dependent methyltransferase n=1 Tax=Streptomyces sp. BE147 TaxID=3002524 RepID=UPI002E7712D4|nr:SAM-dependent methyltransferase [Streptomyces sp. BE147]
MAWAPTVRSPDAEPPSGAPPDFHARAVRCLAEPGIDQFRDLGSGLPVHASTHEVSQSPGTGGSFIHAGRHGQVRSTHLTSASEASRSRRRDREPVPVWP